MRSTTRLRKLPALIALASLGLLGLAPPTALATSSPKHGAAAGQAADPCYPTGKLPGQFAPALGKRGLTVTGPKAPYVGEPTLFCGTLTLAGKPTLQPVAIEVDGKVVASVDAGVDRAWLAWLSLTSAKPETIRAIWHRGKRDQLASPPLTVRPNPAKDSRPTSLDLIARAVAAHRIAPAAGVVDQVYALLAPQKLARALTGSKPMEYLGDSDVLPALADGWPGLSAAQKSAVLSLLGGFAPARRHDRRPSGVQVPTAACGVDSGLGVAEPPFDAKVPVGWAFIGTQHFKIWYLTRNIVGTSAAQSKATARMLADAAENVWDAETGLFGRTPPSDASQRCNGGDGRLDIYAYRKTFATSALTEPFKPWECKNIASYLAIAPDGATSPRSAQAVLAHEFFHTIELSYNSQNSCLQTGWLGEATADWAIDYVYPSNNYEQSDGYDYFHYDYPCPIDVGCLNSHSGYDDYIYLFFLARRYDPDVIPAIWDNLQHSSPRAALDSAVPGGVAASWHEFALDNWNRDPLDNYTAWDKIPYQLSDKPTADIDLGGKHSRIIQFEDRSGQVMTLSSQYQYFPVTDGNVSEITFSHYGFKQPGNGLRIDAVLELGDGQFRQVDWSSGKDQTFCREKANEDITAVLLMYSNGDISGKADENYGRGEQIKILDACTPTGYTGTIKNVLTISNASEDVTQTANSTVTFKYDSAVSNPGLGQYQFDTTTGKVKLKVGGTSGPCTIGGSGSFAIAKWQPPSQMSGPGGQIIANDGISPKAPYSGNGATTGSVPISVHWTCPMSSFDAPYNMEGQWWATDNGTPTNKIKFHQELTGSYTMTGPDGVTNTWTWNLQPIFGS